MNRMVWCDGRLIPEEEMRVSPFDRGLTVGLGLFETLLTVDARPVLLNRHLARHALGCARLGWDVPGEDMVREAVDSVLTAMKLRMGSARVRFHQTAGEGALHDLSRGSGARFFVSASSLPDTAKELALTFSPWPRNERSALVGMKCAAYAENLLALEDARRRGFDDAYFLNTRGEICETSVANLFLVRNGKVSTPGVSSGCLGGVTRGWLLECGHAEERRVTRDDLLEADEVFVTSSTRGPVAVTRVDGREYPAGAITARLRTLWLEMTGAVLG